jgi:putative addiction module component (TIGR02574 family)
MNERGKILTDVAAKLPPDERPELVESILQSLDAATDSRLDQLWANEAKDRLTAYRRVHRGSRLRGIACQIPHWPRASMKLRLLAPAAAELDEALRWYAAQAPRLDQRYLEEVQTARKRIVDYPLAWYILGDGEGFGLVAFSMGLSM